VAAARIIREIVKLTNGGQPRYFPFAPVLSPEEEVALPAPIDGPLFGIQTHLAGMKTKRWGMENWRVFLEGLLESDPSLRVVLLDNEAGVTKLAFSDRIVTTLGWNISQSIRLVQRLSFLLSVDSWAKYIAVANGIPQIVIVPDQRTEYPITTAEWSLQNVFPGFLDDSRVTLIGLEQNPPRLTLPRMADLTPEELLRAVRGKLARLSS
jgi:ADP-heptose:LPS heptosyltransferase